ncbi:MAG: DUF116 domain-containing protein [Dissulfurispiraceae bacterium]|jgi:uncharacterized protein
MKNFLRGIVLRIFYPALMLLGAFFKTRKEGFQIFIIKLNNRLVRAGSYRVSTLLLLLPHCLQTTECDVRITHNILNCKRCGKCEIRDLIKISEDNKLRLFVATGGNIARRIVKDARPEAIIAVACERDLSSGLVDTYPLPVIGIINERPFGPCVNTRVDLAKVQEAIAFFAGSR